MRLGSAMGYAAVGCFSLSAGSCSFLFVNGPPTGHEEMVYFPCTENRAAPVLDVIGVGSSVLGAATAEADPPNELFAWDRGTYVVANLAFAALLGASAWTGFRRVDACRGARLELGRRTEDAAASARSMEASDTLHWPTQRRLILKPAGGIR